MFYYVWQCFMMFSKSRNDRRCRIDDRTAADNLRDRDNNAGIGNNSAGIGDNSAETRDDAPRIADIAVEVTPCYFIAKLHPEWRLE